MRFSLFFFMFFFVCKSGELYVNVSVDDQDGDQ
jgi:hypothetical protein